MKSLLLITFFTLFALKADEAGKNVAIVKVVRGVASVEAESGKKLKIAKGVWIREGAMVKTGDRSFVQLSFVDKSTMNVGPNSEMKIEKFSGKEASVINVLSGKIRSQVSKDYLNMDKEKSKMFVKSKAAVMGIRGTDFIFSAHPKTGAATAVLFEGSVVFNRIKPGDNLKDLESIVNKGRKIHPGQFSVSRPDFSHPTVPAKLSSTQFRALEKNQNFIENDMGGQKKKKHSLVPKGLTGRVVSSTGEGLKKGLEQNFSISSSRDPLKKADLRETKGFIRGEEIKPVDGSLVHIDSGTIIPLGIDSKFDSNAQEWVSNSFESDISGNIVPPAGYSLTDDGKLLKTDKNGHKKQVILEVRPLDQAPPLEEMREIFIKEGPRPANDDGNKMPLPRDPYGECEGECLKRPPVPQGEPPVNYDNLPRERVILPRTPVRFKVTKPVK